MAKKVASMKERRAAEEERNTKRRNTRETVRGTRAGAGGSNKNRWELSWTLIVYISHLPLFTTMSCVICSGHVRLMSLTRGTARTGPG